MKEATITLGLPLLSQSASTNSNFVTETSPKFHLKNIPPLLSSLSYVLHLIMWLFYMIHNCPVITATFITATELCRETVSLPEVLFAVA